MWITCMHWTRGDALSSRFSAPPWCAWYHAATAAAATGDNNLLAQELLSPLTFRWWWWCEGDILRQVCINTLEQTIYDCTTIWTWRFFRWEVFFFCYSKSLPRRRRRRRIKLFFPMANFADANSSRASSFFCPLSSNVQCQTFFLICSSSSSSPSSTSFSSSFKAGEEKTTVSVVDSIE